MPDLSVGKVGLTFHLDRQKNRGNDRQHHAGVITSERVCEASRTNNNVLATRNDRNKEPNQSSLGVICEVQRGVVIEFVPPATQISLLQHGHHSNVNIRLRTVDTLTRTREADPVNTTQDASLHCADKSERKEERHEKQS